MIFVTASSEEKKREQALKAGAIGFLTTPCCEETLD
jgi:CheY-like chemotaxis protein